MRSCASQAGRQISESAMPLEQRAWLVRERLQTPSNLLPRGALEQRARSVRVRDWDRRQERHQPQKQRGAREQERRKVPQRASGEVEWGSTAC